MPQSGVLRPTIRRIWDYFAGIIARQEMERRANNLLTELINLCHSSSNQKIRLVRRYGEYIYARGGCADSHNCIQSHRIDDADYQSILTFFELDLDTSRASPQDIVLGDLTFNVTAELTRFTNGETVTITLNFPSPSTEDSN